MYLCAIRDDNTDEVLFEETFESIKSVLLFVKDNANSGNRLEITKLSDK